jgi:hypothetical protein
MEKALPPPQQLPCPSTTVLFIDSTPLFEIKKVTASQDDGLVGVLKNILVGCTKNKRNQKSHNLSG